MIHQFTTTGTNYRLHVQTPSTNYRLVLTNRLVTLLRNNPATWDLPGMQSKVCQVCVVDFERKAGTVHELQSIRVRCANVYSCARSCSYDFLVIRSFPLLKQAANAYQSLREAFYPHVKVPHSVYASVNVHELLYISAGDSGYYWSIFGTGR